MTSSSPSPSSKNLTALRLAATCIICSLLFSACGWQLRGYQQTKNYGEKKIERLNLQTRSDNRLFLANLKRQLTDLGIELDSAAKITLKVGAENMERRPLSYSSTGIPVQYQLIMDIAYSIEKNNAASLIEQRAFARRQYDFDTELVVAKNEEEKQLLEEMRQELAAKIISELHQ